METLRSALTARKGPAAAGRGFSVKDEDVPNITPFERNRTMPDVPMRQSVTAGGGHPARGRHSIHVPSHAPSPNGPPLARNALVHGDDYLFDTNGRVLTSAEKRAYVKKHGLCPHCCRTNTHRKAFVSNPQPRTNAKVYKGYCLDCYRKEDVMMYLGEIASDDGSSSKPSQKPAKGPLSRRTEDAPTTKVPSVDTTTEGSSSVEGANGGPTAASSNSDASNNGCNGRDGPPVSPTKGRDGTTASPVRFRVPEAAARVDPNGVGDNNNATLEDSFRSDGQCPPPIRFVNTQPSESSVSTIGGGSYRLGGSLPSTIHSSSKDDDGGAPESDVVFDPTDDSEGGDTGSQLHKPVFRGTSTSGGSDPLCPTPFVRHSTDGNQCHSLPPTPFVRSSTDWNPVNSNSLDVTSEAEVLNRIKTDVEKRTAVVEAKIDVQSIVTQMQLDGRNNDHRAVTSALRQHGSKPAIVIEGCKVLCDRALTLLREHQEELEESSDPHRHSATHRRAREKQDQRAGRNRSTEAAGTESDDQDDGWSRRSTRQQRRRAKMEESRPKPFSSGTSAESSKASEENGRSSTEYQPVTVVNPGAFLPEGWAKCLMTLLRDNRENVPVLEELTKTIWILVSLDHRYKTHISGAEGVEGILETMNNPEHKDCMVIQMNSFGILASMSSSLLHAKAVLKRGNTAVSAIMASIDTFSSVENVVDTCHLVEAALRALHVLVLAESSLASSAALPRGNTERIPVQIRNYKEKDGGIRFFLDILKGYSKEKGVEEWGIRLLISILGSSNESDDGDALPQGLETEMVDLLVPLLSRKETRIELMEDVSALLLVLVSRPGFGSSVPSPTFDEVRQKERRTRSMIIAVVNAMDAPEASAVLLWNSCQVLSVFCGIETRAKAAADAGAIEGVVKILNQNTIETTDDLVSVACVALANLCARVGKNKQLAADADGIRGLVRALQRRWGRNHDPKSNLVDNACLALSTLATKQDLSPAFHDVGVLGELVKEWTSGDEEEAVSDVSAARLCAVANVLALVCHEVTSRSQQKAIARFAYSSLRQDGDISVKNALAAVSILCRLSSSVACERTVAASAIDAMMEVEGLSECAGGLMFSERLQSEESLQVECCQLLHNIFAAQKGGVRASWGSADKSIEAISTVMAANRHNVNLQLAAMHALQGLCVSLPPEYIATRLSTQLMAAVGQVSLSMRANGTSEQVQIASCDFLWAVAHVDQTLAVLVVGSNVLDCVVKAMDNFRDSEDVALPACGAIAVMSSVPSNVNKVGTPEIIDCVHDSCVTFGDHVEIVEKCFVTISNLSADTYQVKLEVLRTEGIIGTILASMYQHQTSASIQYSCCATLAYIAIENEVKQLVGSSGGVGAIMGAMSEHTDDAGVQEKACEALCNLISGVPNEILTGNETVKQLVETMRHEKHKGSAVIQEKAISALWNLSVRDVHNKVEIADARGVDCIVGAMGMHLDDEAIQERGSVALWSLCIDVRNQLVVGGAGGVEAILNAMKAHSSAGPIQEQCLGALKVLATNPDNKKRIVENGGVDSIVATLRAHVTNSDIQQAGCAALSNISVYHGSDLAAPMSEDVLDVAMDAMRNHGGVGVVMEAVCRLLRNYSFNADNVELMRSRSEELFAMLLAAAEDFPGRCQDRANDIMNVCLTEVVKGED